MTLHTCELNYTEECLLRNKIKTTRVPGSLPTLNLPVKSFSSNPYSSRGTQSIEKRQQTQIEKTFPVNDDPCYKSYWEFLQRIGKLKLKYGWEIKEKAETVSICNFENEFSVPKYEIIVTSDLGFNILVYNWVLPKSNELHINYKSSFKNITLPTMMSEL